MESPATQIVAPDLRIFAKDGKTAYDQVTNKSLPVTDLRLSTCTNMQSSDAKRLKE
jgi:hypothetical protein